MADPILPPDHPLAQYLLDTADEVDPSPAPLPGHLTWHYSTPHTQHPLAQLLILHLTRLLTRLEPFLRPLWPQDSLAAATAAVGERLKFLVISSPLLSEQLPSAGTVAGGSAGGGGSPQGRLEELPARTPTTPFGPPGKLPPPTEAAGREREGKRRRQGSVWAFALVGGVLALLAGSGTLFVFLQLGCALWSIMTSPPSSTSSSSRKTDPAPNAHKRSASSGLSISTTLSNTTDAQPELTALLEGVQELVTAAENWDTSVSSALELIEADEQLHSHSHSQLPSSLAASPSPAPGSTSQAPTAQLREHLRSALAESTARAESVRQCLAPLTSGSALRQLGEMYAPSSSLSRSGEPPESNNPGQQATSSTSGNPRQGLTSPRRALTLSSTPISSPSHAYTHAQGGKSRSRPQSLHFSRSSRVRPSLGGIGLGTSFSLPSGLNQRASQPQKQQLPETAAGEGAPRQSILNRTPVTSPQLGRQFATLPQTPEVAELFSPHGLGVNEHEAAEQGPSTAPLPITPEQARDGRGLKGRPRSESHLRLRNAFASTEGSAQFVEGMTTTLRSPATVGRGSGSVLGSGPGFGQPNALNLEQPFSPSPTSSFGASSSASPALAGPSLAPSPALTGLSPSPGLAGPSASPSPLPTRAPSSIRRYRSATLSLAPSPSSFPASPTPTPSSTLRRSHAHNTRSLRTRPSIAQRLRAPLSLASLSSLLSSSLSARRWAAAHLLALRFDGDDLSPSSSSSARSPGALGTSPGEREQYWEDVASVVRTWAASLSEVARDLRAEVDEAARKMEDRARMPISPLPASKFSATQAQAGRTHAEGLASPLPLSSSTVGLLPFGNPEGPEGFAPSPTPMGRFLDRTTSLIAGIEDMRALLSGSTHALREWSLSLSTRDHEHDQEPSGAENDVMDERQEVDPLAVYDSIRPVLAAVLREYERGRADLVAVLRKPSRARRDTAEDDGEVDGAENEAEEVPPLSMDLSSASGSEEHASPSHRPLRILESVLARSHPPPQALDPDSHFLPEDALEQFDFARPGIEQVFEDAGAIGAWQKEKSKLTREERIARARAEREARKLGHTAGSPSLPPTSTAPASLAGSRPTSPGVRRPGLAGWAPSGEVVQELKDVIQRVGQRRLALVESQRSSQSSTSRANAQSLPAGEEGSPGTVEAKALPGGGTAPVTPPFSPLSTMPVLETAE